MSESEIKIYQLENGQTDVQVRFDNETVWLNLNQMVELFERDKSVVSRHISKLFKEKELDKNSLLQKMQQLQAMEKFIKLISIILM